MLEYQQKAISVIGLHVQRRILFWNQNMMLVKLLPCIGRVSWTFSRGAKRLIKWGVPDRVGPEFPREKVSACTKTHERRWNSRSDVTVLLESSGPYVRVQFLFRVRCGGSRLIVVLKKRPPASNPFFSYPLHSRAITPACARSCGPEFPREKVSACTKTHERQNIYFKAIVIFA